MNYFCLQMNFSSARIASGSSRKESVQHGTCVHVETIRCASYQDEILNTHESLTIPFDVRSINRKILKTDLFFSHVVSSFYDQYYSKLSIKTER